jgi:DNA-binding LytR/AlgR family response regulator
VIRDEITLNIAICEDEEEHKNILVELLKAYPFESEYDLSTFQNGKDVIDLYEKGKRFDIIFLDMCLGSEDGIDVAGSIRKFDKKTRIVITTSLIEYAVKGYSVNANEFILKPLSYLKLAEVMKKIENDIKRERLNFLEIEIRNEKIILRTDDILYFESYGRKLKVATLERSYEYYHNISSLEKELDPIQFIFCHRSYVINLKNVKSVIKGSVIMKNGASIPVSAKRNQQVLDEFTLYLSRVMR